MFTNDKMLGDPFGPLPAGGAVPFFSYKTLLVLQKTKLPVIIFKLAINSKTMHMLICVCLVSRLTQVAVGLWTQFWHGCRLIPLWTIKMEVEQSRCQKIAHLPVRWVTFCYMRNKINCLGFIVFVPESSFGGARVLCIIYTIAIIFIFFKKSLLRVCVWCVSQASSSAGGSQRQLVGVNSLFLPRGSQGWNWRHRGWQQVPFPPCHTACPAVPFIAPEHQQNCKLSWIFGTYQLLWYKCAHCVQCQASWNRTLGKTEQCSVLGSTLPLRYQGTDTPRA